MTLRLGIFAAIFAALAVPASAVPLAYTSDLDGGNGSVIVTEVPELDMKIEIVGSNGFSFGGVDTLVSFVYGGNDAFDLDFSWSFDTIDWVSLDPFGYFVGNTRKTLTSSCQCIRSESGSFSFHVSPGTTFGFYIRSLDDAGGPATATVAIDKGVIPVPAPIPLPATGALILPALGALGLMRRKAKAKS